MAQFRPADHTKGDANTIGGYASVHERPAAFEGSDGFSYSVELMVEPTDRPGEWGGFLLFVRWSRIGSQAPEGHLETDYLVRERRAEDARTRLGALSLSEVRTTLDAMIRARGSESSSRRWLSGTSEPEGDRE